ncbi:two-component system sensor histidine kinase QseC [Stenotrophomonas sp. AN71]|uniref:histidine kinase dimerization/phospho-acceptor domain-containing protein n=1 Tax=Stenotrophomonas sp. AN71 TaxID=3156253 RepID=UPI003D22F534
MSSRTRGSGSIYRSVVLSTLLAIGGAVGALFFTMDYWVDREVHAHLDRVLLERARTLQGLLPLTMARHRDGHQASDAGSIDLDVEFFSLYGADGHLLRQSTRNAGRSLPFPGLSAARQPQYYDATLPDGRHGRAVAIPVQVFADGRTREAMLVVANDREGWDKAETRIHTALLFATVLISVLVSLMAIGRVRRAFAFLRRTAAEVSRLDVNEPLRPIGEQFPVELAPFAKAFNTGVQRLYQAVDRERRFASNVAHELRTPLAEIRSSAESALAADAPAQSRLALEETLEATLRMQRSVDALLQLARLESGQDVPLSDPLDLQAQLAEAVRGAQRSPAGDARSLLLRAGGATWVTADVAILERIFANLLANAVEYAEGPGDIVCAIDADATAVWVVISNPAPALREHDLLHFGQRFWRRDPQGGTARHAGLGLALSLGLAQAHGLQLLFQVDAGRLQAQLGPFAAL